MTMRPLLIGPAEKKAVEELVAFASREENWYRPGVSQWVPGDRLEYVLSLGTYRCVFTYTEGRGKLYRHLSISVPGTLYPNPVAATTIAVLFGFTGARMRGDTPVHPGPT